MAVPVVGGEHRRVLFGEVDPTGRLPVSIPGPDGAELFEFGHGLGY